MAFYHQISGFSCKFPHHPILWSSRNGFLREDTPVTPLPSPPIAPATPAPAMTPGASPPPSRSRFRHGLALNGHVSCGETGKTMENHSKMWMKHDETWWNMTVGHVTWGNCQTANFRGRQLQLLQPGQATVLLEGFFGEYLGVHHYPMDLMGKMFFFLNWFYLWTSLSGGSSTMGYSPCLMWGWWE